MDSNQSAPAAASRPLTVTLTLFAAAAGLAMAWTVASALQASFLPDSSTGLLCAVLLAADLWLDGNWALYKTNKHYAFGAVTAAALYFHLDWAVWTSIGAPAALSLSLGFVLNRYTPQMRPAATCS